MTIQEVAGNLFFFQRGYLNGNHLAYRDEDAGGVLIDTGYIAHSGETLRLLRRIGVRPERIKTIVNTHCHCDHVGANRAVQELSGCDVVLSHTGKQFMDHHDDLATWWRYFNQEAAFFSVTSALGEGDLLHVGPHTFRVLRTPGHSADSISLYLPEEKLLISGDTLWEKDVAVINESIEGRSAPYFLLESLARLEVLEAEVVCPGHGRRFTDVATAVARSKELLRGFIADRRQMALDLVRKLIVFTLLMRGPQPEKAFRDGLVQSVWFTDAVRGLMEKSPEEACSRVMRDLQSKKIVMGGDGLIWTTVRP